MKPIDVPSINASNIPYTHTKFSLMGPEGLAKSVIIGPKITPKKVANNHREIMLFLISFFIDQVIEFRLKVPVEFLV